MNIKKKIDFLRKAGFEVHYYKEGQWQELTIERSTMDNIDPIIIYNDSVDNMSVDQMIERFLEDYKEDVLFHTKYVK